MNIGVLLPNWIGDAVMATPALRSLRGLAGPTGRLAVFGKPHICDVLRGLGWIDAFVELNPKKDARKAAGLIRGQSLNQLVLLPNSLRSAWLARRAGVPERIGYARPLRTPLLTTVLREPKRNGQRLQLPTLDHYLQLAYAAGGDYVSPELELATTDEDRNAADAAWQDLGLPPGDRVVVFNSGGAFGASKRWPDEHFATLARRLHDKLGLAVLVNCGPAEQELARNIVELAHRPSVVSLAGRDLPVGLAKAVVERSRLLVSTDSGPRFFGIAFRKPVVTLFGPTDPRHSDTHYAEETTLSLDLDCQPCWASSCPLGHHKCMEDLSVERAFGAIKHRLGEGTRREAA